MPKFKIYKVSASADEQYEWSFFVHATSLEDCYSKLEESDREYVDTIEDGDVRYSVKKFPKLEFQLIEPFELPF
jgi:hypothetical protein